MFGSRKLCVCWSEVSSCEKQRLRGLCERRPFLRLDPAGKQTRTKRQPWVTCFFGLDQTNRTTGVKETRSQSCLSGVLILVRSGPVQCFTVRLSLFRYVTGLRDYSNNPSAAAHPGGFWDMLFSDAQ